MGINKITLNTENGEEVLINLTGDGVTEDTLFEDVTAHNSKGEPIKGKFPIGEVDTQSNLIEQIKSALVGKSAGSGGSSSSSGVFKETERIQVSTTEIYVYASEVLTAKEFLLSLGVQIDPNIYVVDDLSNMLESNIQLSSTGDVISISSVNLYILRSDGIVYLNVPAVGGIITLGLLGFKKTGYDKGFVKNKVEILEYSIAGVYTTLETYRDIDRYYTSKNGKEISAYVEFTNYMGDLDHEGEEVIDIEVLSGDVTSRVLGAGDIISGEIEELNEYHFLKRNGTYITNINNDFFSGTDLSKVTLPKAISTIGIQAFARCEYLQDVTFKGKPNYISSSAFDNVNPDVQIRVPWSEGEVANEPWGAIGATIRYNYTGG